MSTLPAGGKNRSEQGQIQDFPEGGSGLATPCYSDTIFRVSSPKCSLAPEIEKGVMLFPPLNLRLDQSEVLLAAYFSNGHFSP